MTTIQEAKTPKLHYETNKVKGITIQFPYGATEEIGYSDKCEMIRTGWNADDFQIDYCNGGKCYQTRIIPRCAISEIRVEYDD
jgi:hypothetical protein